MPEHAGIHLHLAEYYLASFFLVDDGVIDEPVPHSLCRVHGTPRDICHNVG
jgi:hypothetical protein